MKAYNLTIKYEDVKVDADDLRHLVASRADMLAGRQRRKYDPTRAAEIKALQAAYDILVVVAHPDELTISHEHLAQKVSQQIIASGNLRSASI